MSRWSLCWSVELSKAMDCFGDGVCNMKSRSPDGEGNVFKVRSQDWPA